MAELLSLDLPNLKGARPFCGAWGFNIGFYNVFFCCFLIFSNGLTIIYNNKPVFWFLSLFIVYPIPWCYLSFVSCLLKYVEILFLRVFWTCLFSPSLCGFLALICSSFKRPVVCAAYISKAKDIKQNHPPKITTRPPLLRR